MAAFDVLLMCAEDRPEPAASSGATCPASGAVRDVQSFIEDLCATSFSLNVPDAVHIRSGHCHVTTGDGTLLLAASQFELRPYSHVVSFTGPAAAEGRFPVSREEDAAKSMMSRYRGRTFATYLDGVRLPLGSAAPGFIGSVGSIRLALRTAHDDVSRGHRLPDTPHRRVHVDRHLAAEAPAGCGRAQPPCRSSRARAAVARPTLPPSRCCGTVGPRCRTEGFASDLAARATDGFDGVTPDDEAALTLHKPHTAECLRLRCKASAHFSV